MKFCSVRFLLSGEIHTLQNVNPNTTVLRYLRDTLGRCGSKEGCASGDCGACTVVVGEFRDDDIHYRSINSCITLVASLHGKQLITVEDLKIRDAVNGDRLHPIQQSMMTHNGSQCGFCTPGIVMSLYALNKNNPSPSRSQALEALSGNLCRCTGYRSIVSAALNIPSHEPPDTDTDARMQLEWMESDLVATLSDGQHHYHAPTDIDGLATLFEQNPSAALLAGSTDLALAITQQHRDIKTIIDISRVAELQMQERDAMTLHIGAAVSYRDCQPSLQQEYPELGSMLERLGSLQIRNRATIGGNIGNASPIADMPPVLLALGAQIVLRKGEHIRSLALDDYFIDYKVTALAEGEFIQHIEIPRARPGYQLRIYKISKRTDDDISTVLAAFHLRIEDHRVRDVALAFGGMAAIPARAVHAERALAGQRWEQAAIDEAMQALEQDFTPLSDVRASAWYRMQVAKNLLQKCWIETSGSTALTRISANV